MSYQKEVLLSIKEEIIDELIEGRSKSPDKIIEALVSRGHPPYIVKTAYEQAEFEVFFDEFFVEED